MRRAKEKKGRWWTVQLPISGTASLVFGIISDTMFINTVRESKIVTPENVARF